MSESEAKPLRLTLTAEGDETILSHEALSFLEDIVARFSATRDSLLDARKERQRRIDDGETPCPLSDTADIRNGDWQVAPPPAVLRDRRVEITAPAERKMAILALNSAAKVYMADFEDSLSPTWNNLISGQRALYDIARQNAELKDEARGKEYRLDPDHNCVLIVRPRGWHLPEKHVLYEGRPISGALFDFALFFFHNAKVLAQRERGPFFYLPKMEHWREAALWDDILSHAEKAMGLPVGTTKTTALIETLPAVFQMHEILHATKGRMVGLNCGRWDYIFSYIKTLRMHGDRVLPERKIVTMRQHLMNAYSTELVKTCHQRNAHAMGGMSAFIPIKSDPVANDKAFEKVREDKILEAGNGHDGTWVAHPDLIVVAAEVFNQRMPKADQKHVIHDIRHTPADFLGVPPGGVSLAGFNDNIQVSLLYLAAWLGGTGAVPLFNMMEDAATAEIARAQLWQWVHYPTLLSDDKEINTALFRESLERIVADCKNQDVVGGEHLPTAKALLEEMVLSPQMDDFLTLKAYPLI